MWFDQARQWSRIIQCSCLQNIHLYRPTEISLVTLLVTLRWVRPPFLPLQLIELSLANNKFCDGGHQCSSLLLHRPKWDTKMITRLGMQLSKEYSIHLSSAFLFLHKSPALQLAMVLIAATPILHCTNALTKLSCSYVKLSCAFSCDFWFQIH